MDRAQFQVLEPAAPGDHFSKTRPAARSMIGSMKRLVLLALFACAAHVTGMPTGPSMEILHEVNNVSVSIRREPADVYAFVSSEENIPRWATGLATSVRRVDGDWIAEGPIGRVKVRFAPPNDLGVVDHDVVFDSGVVVHNPMRIVPNGTGSTIIFTLLRQPGVSERQFAEDARTVEKDLELVKGLLEAG